MSTQNQQIASTILTQLGGNKFLAMTGAHTLIAIKNGLRMRLRRNKSISNMLRITLTPDDTYKMEFLQLRKNDFKVVECFDGVYFDMLQELFTQVTGMYTRL